MTKNTICYHFESNQLEYDMTMCRLEIDQWFITDHSPLTGRLNKQHVTDWSGPLQKEIC